MKRISVHFTQQNSVALACQRQANYLSTLFSQKYEKMKTAVSNVITDFQYLVTDFFEKYSDSMYGSLNIFRDGNYHWLSHMLLLRIDIKDKQQNKLSFYILQSSERYDERVD